MVDHLRMHYAKAGADLTDALQMGATYCNTTLPNGTTNNSGC